MVGVSELRTAAGKLVGNAIGDARNVGWSIHRRQISGLLLMPIPTRLGMLFVHPGRLRKRIATTLWECARTRIESNFPEVRTVELNSTPYAVDFYRAVGFVSISAQLTRGGLERYAWHAGYPPAPSVPNCLAQPSSPHRAAYAAGEEAQHYSQGFRLRPRAIDPAAGNFTARCSRPGHG
ncbi:MAG: GNAT family N-acetyltransferase [Steroidobacteraceae bacterium]